MYALKLSDVFQTCIAHAILSDCLFLIENYIYSWNIRGLNLIWSAFYSATIIWYSTEELDKICKMTCIFRFELHIPNINAFDHIF